MDIQTFTRLGKIMIGCKLVTMDIHILINPRASVGGVLQLVYVLDSLCIDRLSPIPWLLWMSNLEIWTSTMGPRNSKTLETFCRNESIFRAAS